MACQKAMPYFYFINLNGLTTRKGKRWNQASIQNILRSRLYLGYISKGGVVSPHRPELQIVDEAIFEEVQHIREIRIAANKTQNAEVTFHRKSKSLLNGFAFCGHCGARLSGASNRREYRRKDGSIYRRDKGLYRCNASIDGVPTDCDGQRTYRSQRVYENFKEIVPAILQAVEAKLRNAEQLRREIEVKQLKYCGLKQVFETGTMDEKKMLLSIMIHRVEISRNYEMNIKLAPGFEQFIDGLIKLR